MPTMGSAQYRKWEMSGFGNVRDGNCPDGKYPGWEMSGMGIVRTRSATPLPPRLTRHSKITIMEADLYLYKFIHTELITTF